METAYEHELTRIADSLVYKYEGSLDAGTVRAAVDQAQAELEPGCKVRTFLPVLIERHAEVALRKQLKASGLHATRDIVFLDAHNTGRSQLAGALLQHQARELVHVHTAGVEAPGDGIQPEVVEVLHEVGIDISRQLPKPVHNDLVHLADVLVLLGVHPDRLGVPAVNVVEWDVPDTAGMSVDGVRAVRDQLSTMVDGLLADLTIQHA